MQYLLLIYGDQNGWDSMSEEERGQVFQAYGTYTQELENSGSMVGGNALQPTETATTVRVRNGRLATTDGPFAETKEQLGGYYLVQAKDLNEAIQVASRIPGARLGAVEIRPIVEF